MAPIRLTPQQVKEYVLEPLALEYGRPKRLEESDVLKAKFLDRWTNSLGHFAPSILKKAVDIAIDECEHFPRLSKIKKIATAEARIARLKAQPQLPPPAPKWSKQNHAQIEKWFDANKPIFEGDTLQVCLLRHLCLMVAFSSDTVTDISKHMNMGLGSFKNLNPGQRNALDEFAEGFAQFLQQQQKQGA